MSAIFARKALISKGWAANVRLGIHAGRIASLTEGADPEYVDQIIPFQTGAQAFGRELWRKVRRWRRARWPRAGGSCAPGWS